MIGSQTITTIGTSAFESKGLTAVTIPDTVTTIQTFAFAYNNISTVRLSNNVTALPIGVFLSNKLTEVTIPSSVTSIGINTFMLQGSLGAQGMPELTSNDPARAQAAFDSFWYARLYTQDPSNPRGFVDRMLTEGVYASDYNADGDMTDSIGGYIINPATVTVSYKDTAGNTIAPNRTMTGTDLTTYASSTNAANDMTLYYHLGQTRTIAAPEIAGYTAPADASMTFAARTNTLTFVYEQNAAAEEPAPTTPAPISPTIPPSAAGELAPTGANLTLLVALAVAAGLAGVGLFVYRKKFHKF